MKRLITVVLLLFATTAMAWDGAGWDALKSVVKTKTAAFTFSLDDDIYLVSTAGGGLTATLPAPTGCAGKEWTVVLTTANGAVTFDASPYSVNGAVTDANMDAVGDAFQIICTGSAYLYSARYIH